MPAATITERDLETARALGGLEARVKTCESRQTVTDRSIQKIDSRLRYLEIRVAGIVVVALCVFEFARWWVSGGG